MDRRLVAFAECHHGLVTRELLLATGFTDDAIKHAQRSQWLRSVRRGVYCVVGTPDTWMRGLAAVVLSVDGAVVSHASAAAMYDLRAPSDQYEITTSRARQVRTPGVRAHRSVCWLREDEVMRRGLAASSTSRLIVDLSGRLTPVQLGKMIDALARRRLLRIADLARTSGRLRAAPGRSPTVVEDLIAARCSGYSPGDSDLEARVIRALQRHGLRLPTAQQRIKVGDRRYRIDLCYPDVKLAIEIDSWAYHRWRSTFDGDRAKRNDLTLAGYRVLQVTDGMSDRDIAAAIAQGLAPLGELGAL